VSAQETAQPSPGCVLNVLLHGSITYVQDKQARQILALIPEIDHHVCRAGSWLGETDLKPAAEQEPAAEYVLKGDKTPTDDAYFDPQRNLIVKFERILDKPLRAKLTFPLPKQITSLRVADVPRKLFAPAGVLASASETQHMATLHVFTYDIENENELGLRTKDGGGHYWEPVVTGKYVNLHIFSAEDHFEGPSNAAADFKDCAKLLGLDLVLNGSLLASGISDVSELPPGVTAEETEDLGPRTLRMARLGRLVTGNGDANLAWYGNDALDGNPCACTGPIGD